MWYLSDFVFKFVSSVSLAVTDFRGTFAGFACSFGNVPSIGDSRKRYDYKSKAFFFLNGFQLFFPRAFPSLFLLFTIYILDG